MIAVQLTPSGEVQVVEVARPQLEHPTDAILLVTTAAIGPWEISDAKNHRAITTPGTQFLGTVVETGEQVTQVNIDDLVVATSTAVLPNGKRVRFGSDALPGGHAEYVQVPDADNTLVKTTAAAEERSVFAGGEAALGICTAENALAEASDRPIAILGCDSSTLTAVAWLRHKRPREAAIFVMDNHPAALAAAKSLGAKEIAFDDLTSAGLAAIICGMSVATAPPGLCPVYSTDPDASGADPQCEWPSLESAKRAEMSVRLRQIDLTPLVSTVLPLDQAAEAYRAAIERPLGTRAVLLKP